MVIGLRQAKIAAQQTTIADRQARILEKQAHLEELKLRTDLFERRFSVYQNTRSFCGEIVAHADKPSTESQTSFLISLDQSKFIFRPSVYVELKELWARSNRFFAVKSVMKHKFDTTGDYGQENIDAEHEYLLWIVDRMETLSDLFGDEAKLSTHFTPS